MRPFGEWLNSQGKESTVKKEIEESTVSEDLSIDWDEIKSDYTSMYTANEDEGDIYDLN